MCCCECSACVCSCAIASAVVSAAVSAHVYANALGLPLGLEAHVMTPNGVIILLFLYASVCAAVHACCTR